jgi:hypothetical protein
VSTCLSLGQIDKDPFTAFPRANMLSAYAYLDQLLEQGIAPLSDASLEHLLGLNERVHYGTNVGVRARSTMRRLS